MYELHRERPPRRPCLRSFRSYFSAIISLSTDANYRTFAIPGPSGCVEVHLSTTKQSPISINCKSNNLYSIGDESRRHDQSGTGTMGKAFLKAGTQHASGKGFAYRSRSGHENILITGDTGVSGLTFDFRIHSHRISPHSHRMWQSWLVNLLLWEFWGLSPPVTSNLRFYSQLPRGPS